MKKPIVIDGVRCSGCRICHLVCSISNYKANNPKKSAIRIYGLFPEPKFEAVVCNQCGKCAEVCPEEAISQKDGVYIIDKEKCSGCGTCVDECPSGAMFIHSDLKEPIKCVLCYECVKMCPMKAIKTEKSA
ncbi:MAG: 4Fe-4S dicluster domain-containing protein [Planctomycetota bacterium]